MEAFIRCDYCGNTYHNHEPWCPHCLAPRPKGHEWPSAPLHQEPESITFYSDGEPYYIEMTKPTIPEPYGTVTRR